MRHFGIDLGTSSCSVSYAVNSARPNYVPPPVVVEFRADSQIGAKSAAVPSVVARTEAEGDTDTLHGFDAERAIRERQVVGRNCRQIFRSVKSHLGTGRSYVRAHHSLNTPVKVWGSLIRRLCEMTVEAKGADFDPRKHPTVLTVPASFGRAQRNDTLEAAELAGFEVDTPGRVQLIDEPVAALIDTLNYPDLDLYIDPSKWNKVLVFDFGGGTCDLVTLKVRYDATKPGGLEVWPQSISPYQQVGGDTIDLAIMKEVVWPQVCKRIKLSRDELSAIERNAIEDNLRYNVCRILKHQLNEELQKQSLTDFQSKKWADVSVEKSLDGYCNDVRDMRLVGSATCTADELDEVMSPFLELDPQGKPFRVSESQICYPFATLIGMTLERAGMNPENLDLVVLHGGSCLSPFVPQLFRQMREEGIFKNECKVINTPDLITSVARGAALCGSLSAKYGRSYIPPIVPEDLSVLTEGGKYEPLVEAGTPLPVTKSFTGNKRFYLTENGQREITLPIHVGHEERRRASTLVIPIEQPRLLKSHPVEVELTINEDKISHWRCRPEGHDWCDAHEIANPWIGQEPSKEVDALLSLRGELRSVVETGAKPKARTLAAEALAAARAGYPEEGLRLIEDVINDHQNDAEAWNSKGLIHGIRGEPELSAFCYHRAADFDPDIAVYRGNYGVALHRIKKHAEAVEVMRDALSRDRTLTDYHFWLANAFAALGNHGEEKKELERWHMHARQRTIQRPEDVEAWEELAITATRLGEYDEAEEAREQIWELKRDRNLLASPSHG